MAMMFEPGDKIALKATGEEGIVVKLLDKKMAEITIGKTTFIVFEKDIEHPYFNWFANKTIIENKKPKVYIDTIAKESQRNTTMSAHGMHIVLFPVYKNLAVDDAIEKVKVYISNNQVNGFNFSYFFEAMDGTNFELASEVLPKNDFYVHDISYEHLATNPYFELNFSEVIKEVSNKPLFVHEQQFSIKPIKLLQLINEMHEQGKPFLSFFCFNTTPHLATPANKIEVKPHQINTPKPKKEVVAIKQILPLPTAAKATIINKPKLVEHYFTNPHEVDLHINFL
jgi:hypothetical protein